MSSPSYTFKSSGSTTRPSRMKPPPQPDFTPPRTRSRSSSLSSTTSFTSAVSNHDVEPNNKSSTEQPPSLPRFSPSEEATMRDNSNTLKLAANKQFAKKDYSSAISTYDKALSELPIYLDYELAVLQSNISACHLQLGEWKDAIESAERGLECLEREMPTPKPKISKENRGENGKNKKKKGSLNAQDQEDDEEDGQIVELPDDTTDEKAAEMLAKLDISDQKKKDIIRIRSKLLLRRARSKVMLCETSSTSSKQETSSFNTDDSTTSTTQQSSKQSNPFSSFSNDPNSSSSTKDPPSHWSNLSAALTDYQTLSTPEYFSILPQGDKKTVTQMLATLPPRVEAAKKKEVDEMMGKLKELGNGILKPFGLSTDMFKMTQDPATGGWSMGFDSGKDAKK